MASFEINVLSGDTVPPHLAPLRLLIASGFSRRSCLTRMAALKVYEYMKLKPEHVKETADTLQAMRDLVQQRKEKFSAYVAGHITKTRKALLARHEVSGMDEPAPASTSSPVPAPSQAAPAVAS